MKSSGFDSTMDGTLKRSRGVSFHPNTRVYIVQNYSSDECLWYTIKDYESFRRECSVFATMMDLDVPYNANYDSPCGLDAWTDTGSRWQRERRKDALRVVLNEQFAQWKEGELDSESIAKMYHIRAYHSTTAAMNRALELEQGLRNLRQTHLPETKEGTTKRSKLSQMHRLVKAQSFPEDFRS
jgi:hypothetical protein